MKTEYLLHREMEHVLAALTPSNRLVARVCLHTGLRVSDALALTREQLGKTRFWIREGKTGKAKMVALPERLRMEILAQSGEKYAFPGRNDPEKHRSRQAVWRDLKRAAAAFRLPQNVGTHSLRKVYAVELLDKYGDIERVKRALNHSNLTVTLLYAMADKLLQARRGKRQTAVDKTARHMVR